MSLISLGVYEWQKKTQMAISPCPTRNGVKHTEKTCIFRSILTHGPLNIALIQTSSIHTDWVTLLVRRIDPGRFVK